MIPFKGRRKILTQYTPNEATELSVIASIINSTITTHRANKTEIDYLFNYYKGIQPILNKTKIVRDDINNIVVINNAQRITRTITGYFLGNDIQYIQASGDVKDQIDRLNRILSYEDKHSVDRELAENQSVCGTAYRILITGDDGDEIPFEDRSLDPARTYVVYENSLTSRPVVGITYHPLLNSKGEVDGYRYYAYTVGGLFILDSNSEGFIDADSRVTFSGYSIGGIPIIEYPNNTTLTGDWELHLTLMDSINDLYSGRLDDIEQIVESLLVFVNAEIDGDTYDEMREKGVLLLKNTTQLQSSVDVIKNPLDQTGMNLFAKELENLLDTLAGIPSRDSRASSGGDTGQAVELRDGWADLEIVARNKEAMFKRSEKQTLKLILNLMKAKQGLSLSMLDIDIKFTRNKNHNLLVKTQSYETLINSRTLAPADCLTIVDLVSDVNEYVARGEDYWNAKAEEDMAKATKIAEMNTQNSEDDSKESDEVK